MKRKQDLITEFTTFSNDSIGVERGIMIVCCLKKQDTTLLLWNDCLSAETLQGSAIRNYVLTEK